jgi:hypothetical protein
MVVDGSLQETVQIEDGVAHIEGTFHETVQVDGETYEMTNTFEQSIPMEESGGGFLSALGDLFG